MVGMWPWFAFGGVGALVISVLGGMAVLASPLEAVDLEWLPWLSSSFSLTLFPHRTSL